MGKFGQSWANLGKFGQVWVSLGKFEQVWTRQQSSKIKMKHNEAKGIRKGEKIEW